MPDQYDPMAERRMQLFTGRENEMADTLKQIRLDVVATTTMPNEPELSDFFNPELPEPLKKVSIKFYDIAQWMLETLPASAQRAQGLWDLLRAKDCAVRAMKGSLEAEGKCMRNGCTEESPHVHASTT